jgi:putative (di)nucleoside polyphosphate hydrolase
MDPSQFFRAGAGGIVLNGRGLVLALERLDIPGAWQFPQGGLKRDEDPLQAAFREIAEETAIPHADLELVASFPEPLVYELPAAARNRKTGRGQVQYWFLFRFHGNNSSIDVQSGGEFRSWTWTPFAALLRQVAEFRRPVYQRLADHFREHIAPPEA